MAKMVKICDDKRLYSADGVKEILLNTGGVFNFDGEWITLESDRIAGIVEYNSTRLTCSIIILNDRESYMFPLLAIDGKMHISASNKYVDRIFKGTLTNENVAIYNKSASFESRIVKYIAAFSFESKNEKSKNILVDIDNICHLIEHGDITCNDTISRISNIQISLVKLHAKYNFQQDDFDEVIIKLIKLVKSIAAGNIKAMNIVSRLDAIADKIKSLELDGEGE